MIRRSRLERAEQLGAATVRLAAGQTQRQVAAELGVARSTLQDWRKPEAVGAAPAVLAAWMETPEGVRWLHQLVLAAHFSITLQGAAGIRVVCQFLELSGLSAFVGASYGTQQGLNAALEEALVAVAEEQRAALARGMPHRDLTVCEDETFHPQMGLVALEPVSGFLLLEQYAADRQAATWTQALQEALVGLDVAVIQGTSDEAGALHRHVEVDLGVHHSPDLFHGQHEVSKATSLHLARQVRQAAATVTAAQTRWAVERAAQQAYEDQSPRPCGRPPAFAARIRAAVSEVVQAEIAHAEAQARQCEARELVRELGIGYHPYDLECGQAQPVEQVAQRLNDVWTRLGRLAAAAELPTRARERLAKAQRLTTQLLATIPFFFATLQVQVEALALPLDLERALVEELIPALYLERVAERSTLAEPRHRLRALSRQLLEPLRHGAHPIQALPSTEIARLEQVAGECADRFQRSSSGVEGRNGQLALHHQGRHRLSDRKLAALTAVHNYHIRRADGTTAAERFFSRAHETLFTQALQRMPLPPRPARRRLRPPKPPYLMPLAA
ncbi:DUF6399 domain-containing protein [Candidatus Accumulibacter contiguus]|uniref:DUF6399 domain-containing protein n=1 Tax=Candidatus Accumulibacter contiguus TaxID=2954381 RepID=UPI002FC3A847